MIHRWSSPGRLLPVCGRSTSGQHGAPPHRRYHPRPRRGAVLIIALVCLALITVISGALLRWSLNEHKLLAGRQRQSQAFWLAEAGIDRAAANLVRDPGYIGETWIVEAADMIDDQAARVRINVMTVADQTRQRIIEVVAEYPLESKAPTRIQKQVIYHLPQGEDL